VPWYFEGTTQTADQGDIQVSTLINGNTATVVPATGADTITSEWVVALETEAVPCNGQVKRVAGEVDRLGAAVAFTAARRRKSLMIVIGEKTTQGL
jgi:hypothetical protein